MAITDLMVLPKDVVVVPVNTLPSNTFTHSEAQPHDWAVSRRRSRAPSCIVSSDMASLLLKFREARTIVDAVIVFAKDTGRDPHQTLDEAFPFLQRFMDSRWLVLSGSKESAEINETLASGTLLGKYEVISCIQVWEDTELYQARDAAGRRVALKVARPPAVQRVDIAFRREAKILEFLNGSPSAKLIEVAVEKDERYLAIEWVSGVPITVVAAECRSASGQGAAKLKELCCNVLETYGALHARQVIHGDVHPGNILVDANGYVRLIDFGHSVLVGSQENHFDVTRQGMPEFFDPQLAESARANHPAPPATYLAEQYSIGSLLYLLLTGKRYLDFSVESAIAMRQIVEDPPLHFSHHGVAPWPDVEQFISRSLSKKPEDRFPSVAAFAVAFKNVAVPHVSPKQDRRPKSIGNEFVDRTIFRLRPEGPLFAEGLPYGPVASINFGAAGIAYALYRMACIRVDAKLLTMADLWATRAAASADKNNAFGNEEVGISERTVGAVSPYHTVTGVYAVQVLVAQARGDFVSMGNAIDQLVRSSAHPRESLDLAVGRSSILIACSLTLEAVGATPFDRGESTRKKAVVDLGNRVCQTVWDEVAALPSIARCEAIEYTGIAHGWAGLCYAALIWSEVSSLTVPNEVKARLDQLAALAEPKGRGVRWPIQSTAARRRNSGHGYLTSWCHGTPGHVHLWWRAFRRYGEPRYRQLAESAAWNAWEDHEDDCSLCCGLAGRAYALLAAYRETGDVMWLDRAQELARMAQAGRFYIPAPTSLYKGELGVALLTADLEAPEDARHPFFELARH